MVDIQVDEDFYLVLDETNDLGRVTGKDEFEQNMRHYVTEYFFEHIGDRNNANVVKKLRIKARRVAMESKFVNSLQSIEIDNQEGDSLTMTINYNGSDEYQFGVI